MTDCPWCYGTGYTAYEMIDGYEDRHWCLLCRGTGVLSWWRALWIRWRFGANWRNQ